MNPYFTHQETLNSILESFDYSKSVHCLEFGSGDGSSSIFNRFASTYSNLQVECFEHDLEWSRSMNEKYSLQNYVFNVVDWSNFKYDRFKSKIYDLVFVDQGDWDARIVTIDQLMFNARYIVLHDYCYYNGHRGMTEPTSQDLNSFGKDSFFEKYNQFFEMSSVTELYPPTLIFKSKEHL